MSVFFVHDVGKGIVSPLDRKFSVRDIPPTEEVQASHRIHDKKESNPDEYREHAPYSQHKKNKQASLAVSSYQENQQKVQDFGYVRDIMSQPVLTIAKDQSLYDAWKVMEKYEIHHLIILDQEQRYCGLLSEKKIVPLLMRNERTSSKDMSLENFCQEPLLSTHPSTSINDLAPALLELGLDGIAVYENHKVVGIVTYADILKVILKAKSVKVDA